MQRNSDSKWWIFAYDVCYTMGFFRPVYSKQFVEFHTRLQKKMLGGGLSYEEAKKEEKN
jgi:hypothetical protein